MSAQDQPLRTEANAAWWRHDVPAAPQARVPAAADDTESKWPFRMLLAFTFILLLAPQQVFPVLAPLRIAMLVIAGSVIAYIWSRLMTGQPLFEFKPAIKPTLVLVTWAVLTVPTSYWPGGSVAFLTGEYFKTLTVFFLLSHIIDSTHKLKVYSWGLVLMAMPLAITGVANWAAGSFVSGSQRVVGYRAPLTENPNDLAMMLNLLLPFAIALFLGSRGFLLRTVLGGAVCIIVAAVILTFSRSGFLALAVIFAAYLWRLRHRRERVWIPFVLLMIVLSLPFLPDSYYDRIGTITNIEADASGSAQDRYRDMRVATGLVLTHPIIGAGAGMNIYAMNEARGEYSLEIHNAYLQYGVDLGWPGLILFLMIFGSVYRTTGRVMERSRLMPEPNHLFYLTEGIRISLLAFAVEAMFHPVAYNFYFYLIAGIAIALQTICEREAGPYEPHGR